MLPNSESCKEYPYAIEDQNAMCNQESTSMRKGNFVLHFCAMLIDLMIVFLLSCIICGFLLFAKPIAIGCSAVFTLFIFPGIVFLLHKMTLRSIGECLFCLKADKNRISVWKTFYLGKGYLQTKISLIKIFAGIILILGLVMLCFA